MTEKIQHQSIWTLQTTETWSARIALIFLLVATVAVYKDGITSSFSSDDYFHLLRNVHFQSLGQALSVFTEFDGREYRPVVRLSLWINYQLGESAIPFRITNLLLHLSCIVLLYFLLFYIWRSRGLALMGAALFALHPIHSTSIHFVMGRTDLLAAVFYFGTLLAAIHWHRKNNRVFTVVTWLGFILALLSKEISITLPAMMFAVLVLCSKGTYMQRSSKVIFKIWPFFLAASGYLAIRWIHWKKIAESISVYTEYSLSKALNNYIDWAFGLVYPFDLYAARHFLETSPLAFAIISTMAMAVIGLIAVYFYWPDRKSIYREGALWLSLAWFIVTLLPLIGGNAHRWYLYIPSASLCFVIVGLYRLTPHSRRALFISLMASFLILSAAESIRQSKIWGRQGAISRMFFEQVEAYGIHRMESVYFANVPFGYKSAFLFSFDSLERAIEFRHGQAPKIHILSYMNISDNLDFYSKIERGNVIFHMEPNQYDYFLLPPARRKFSEHEFYNIGSYTARITDLELSGLISNYVIEFPTHLEVPFFHFNGRAIQRLFADNMTFEATLFTSSSLCELILSEHVDTLRF